MNLLYLSSMQFQSNNEYFLRSLMSKRNGITADSLRRLGMAWPPPKKWLQRLTKAPFSLQDATPEEIRNYYNSKPVPVSPPVKSTPSQTKDTIGAIRVNVFTDGACVPNPGVGGWGAIIQPPGGPEIILSGSEDGTTNNRMELEGPIRALEVCILNEFRAIRVISDSRYVVNGMTSWVQAWEKKDYRVNRKNLDLFRRLHDLQKKMDVRWQWVRGHNGHPENERCDQIAAEARRRL